MLRILEAQWNWVVPQGTELIRDQGWPDHIIVQYMTGLDLCIEGRNYAVKPGSVLMVQANIPYSYYCSEELVHSYLHVEGDLSSELQRYGLQPNVLYNPENADEVYGIFRQITLSHYENGLFREEYLDLKVRELLMTLAMQISYQREASDLNYGMVSRLKDLRLRIIANPEKNWSVAEMARQMYLSESYFTPLYRKCFGITPNRDLIAIRIARAKIALEEYKASVAATAEMCGYTNVYHFIRQFKHIVGMTPNQYKRRKAGKLPE